MGNLRSYEPGMPAWVDLETVGGTVEASRFYCGLFGWRVVARHRPIEDSAGYWVFQQDGKDVGGLGPGRQPTWTVYISVADIDEAAETIVRNDGAVVTWPVTIYDAGRLAVFADPQGARFAAWQPEAHTGADIVNEPQSFRWSELSCPDIEAAKRFYNEVFGWEATTWPLGDGSTYTEFSLPGGGDSITGMVQTDQRSRRAAPAQWTVYFGVTDTDRTVRRAGELGGTVSAGPFDLPGVGRIATLNDPEGAVFAVLEPDRRLSEVQSSMAEPS
jgi:uncharacterized protein